MEAFNAFISEILVLATGCITIGFVIGFQVGAQFGTPPNKQDDS